MSSSQSHFSMVLDHSFSTTWGDLDSNKTKNIHEYILVSYLFGGFFCEFTIQIKCILLTLDTRIYQLFNLYFSKKYDEVNFIVMLIAVIVFKTFQISMKHSDVFFSNGLTLPAGTCDEFITRNSEAILKLKDKKMDLNDEEEKVDYKADLNE